MRLKFWVCALCLTSLASAARSVELVVQKGHDEQIARVTLSVDGRFLASAASGESIKLWQAQRGEFLRDLPSSLDELPLAWSPDGRVLLSSMSDKVHARARATGNVRVRQMPSGRVLRVLRGVSTPLFFDGKIVRCTNGKTVSDWSVTTGKRLTMRVLQLPRTKKVSLLWNRETPRIVKVEGSLEDSANERCYAFSRNGKYLVFGGEYGVNTACVWDAKSGRLLHQVHGDKAAFGLAAVSDDARWLVTQGDDPKWQPPNYSATESAYARQFTLHLWDLRMGKDVRVWPGYGSWENGVLFLRFSRDGQHVFSGGDSGSSAWDVRSGRKIADLKLATNVDLSSDDKIFAGGAYQDLRVTDATNGKVLRTLPRQLFGGSSWSWSPDGRFLAGGSGLKVWDAKRGVLLQTPSGGYLTRSRWTDAKTLLTENLQAATTWQIDASSTRLTQQKSVAPHFPVDTNSNSADYSDNAFLSPDGQTLLTNAFGWNSKHNQQGAVYVWDATGQKILRTIQIIDDKSRLGRLDIFWLPDSRRFLVATIKGLEIWDVQDGRRVALLAAPKSWPQPKEIYENLTLQMLAMSREGKYVLAQGAIGDIRKSAVWDTNSGQIVRVLPFAVGGGSSFSPDGTLIISDQNLYRWRTGKKPQLTLPQFSSSPDASSWNQTAPAWSPDGARIVMCSPDAAVVYSAHDGRLLARLSVGGDYREMDAKDWLITTSDGFFSAPDKGRKRIRWRENGVLIPLGSPRDRALRRKFYQSSRVSSVLMGK